MKFEVEGGEERREGKRRTVLGPLLDLRRGEERRVSFVGFKAQRKEKSRKMKLTRPQAILSLTNEGSEGTDLA